MISDITQLKCPMSCPIDACNNIMATQDLRMPFLFFIILLRHAGEWRTEYQVSIGGTPESGDPERLKKQNSETAPSVGSKKGPRTELRLNPQQQTHHAV